MGAVEDSNKLRALRARRDRAPTRVQSKEFFTKLPRLLAGATNGTRADTFAARDKEPVKG